ncbi:MAG: hypothetical protein AAF902_16445 [Chloroflexota bacterium]
MKLTSSKSYILRLMTTHSRVNGGNAHQIIVRLENPKTNETMHFEKLDDLLVYLQGEVAKNDHTFSDNQEK